MLTIGMDAEGCTAASSIVSPSDPPRSKGAFQLPHHSVWPPTSTRYLINTLVGYNLCRGTIYQLGFFCSYFCSSCCFWCWPIRNRYEVYSCANNPHGATLDALFYLLGTCISVCPMLVEQMELNWTTQWSLRYLCLAEKRTWPVKGTEKNDYIIKPML